MSAAPFDATASGYDTEFTRSRTGRMQRAIVWHLLERVLARHPAAQVLELNCGTGEDARWLAERGCHVLATDASQRMLAVTQKKAKQTQLADRITTQVFDFQNVAIWPDGPLPDVVLSNFGGLNCLAPDAARRLGETLARHVEPHASVVLVVMGRTCWWESLYFFGKKNARAALRRRTRGPVAARLDAHTEVATWYYSPAEWAALWPDWKVERVEPVGFWLPPSYLDPLFERLPAWVLRFLFFLEKKCRARVLAGAADHWAMVLRREVGAYQ
jgi:SAM-dependent methyltransferase